MTEGLFLYYMRNQRRTNEYEYPKKKRFPKSYNLPAVHIVGKVSFGKLTLVKFGIFAAPKN